MDRMLDQELSGKIDLRVRTTTDDQPTANKVLFPDPPVHVNPVH